MSLPIRVTGLAALICLLAPQVDAQCAQWTAGFEPRGFDGRVYAIASYDSGSGPELYAAGSFTHVGSTAVTAIARWDGTQWSDVGGGFHSPTSANAGVFDLAVFDDGSGAKLYATGYFDKAGGVPMVAIAVWNGLTWSSVGGGLASLGVGLNTARGSVLGVHDDGGGPALYVGGQFALAGGVLVNSIAKWDGANWSALGGGVDIYGNGGNGVVDSLASFDDGSGPELIVGGGFASASGVTNTRNIARWKNSSWSSMVSTLFMPGVIALASFDDGSGPGLYAGGSFSVFDGVPALGIVKWNGATWSAVAGGVAGSVEALEVLDIGGGPQLFVGGKFGSAGGVAANSVATWSGGQWSDVGGGLTSGGALAVVQAFEVFDDGVSVRLITGGSFDAAGGNVACEKIAAWDTNSWSALSDGQGVGRSVFRLMSTESGPDGAALYAGGDFTTAGSASAYGVARFDGTTWHSLSVGVNGEVTALCMFDEGAGERLFVGGLFSFADSVLAANIARWDGANWSALGSGLNGRVNAITKYAGELYVGGEFTLAGGVVVKNIARWNGSSWNTVGQGINGTQSPVETLVVFDDGAGPQLYIGGKFGITNVPSVSNIARWDGTNWNGVGPSGVDQRVNVLHVHTDATGTALYAGGVFTHASGILAQRIARWNGSAWSALGSGFDQPVAALASYDDSSGAGSSLYAGGDFNATGGINTKRTARWNGSAWSALASQGASDSVYALADFNDPTTGGRELYAGGLFTSMNGVWSNHIARWANPCACTPTTYCTAGTTSHGCVPAISATGTPSATAASGFVLRVDAVEGQKQGHIAYSISGPLANPWSALSTSFLCIKAPTQRTPTQSSGGTDGACDGVMTLDWLDYVATHRYSLGVPFSPGTQVWAQLYFRDPPAPKTTNLSGGLRWIMCP